MPVVRVDTSKESGPGGTANRGVDKEVLESSSFCFHETFCEGEGSHSTQGKVLIICEQEDNVGFAIAVCN